MGDAKPSREVESQAGRYWVYMRVVRSRGGEGKIVEIIYARCRRGKSKEKPKTIIKSRIQSPDF